MGFGRGRAPIIDVESANPTAKVYKLEECDTACSISIEEAFALCGTAILNQA